MKEAVIGKLRGAGILVVKFGENANRFKGSVAILVNENENLPKVDVHQKNPPEDFFYDFSKAEDESRTIKMIKIIYISKFVNFCCWKATIDHCNEEARNDPLQRRVKIVEV